MHQHVSLAAGVTWSVLDCVGIIKTAPKENVLLLCLSFDHINKTMGRWSYMPYSFHTFIFSRAVNNSVHFTKPCCTSNLSTWEVHFFLHYMDPLEFLFWEIQDLRALFFHLRRAPLTTFFSFFHFSLNCIINEERERDREKTLFTAAMPLVSGWIARSATRSRSSNHCCFWCHGALLVSAIKKGKEHHAALPAFHVLLITPTKRLPCLFLSR